MTKPQMQGAIAKSQQQAPKKDVPDLTIKQWIGQYEKEVVKALPSVMTPERFTRICLTAITTTPKLAECTPGSFIGAMMTAAQLGLEPNTPLGQAYLIPYKSKKNGIQCQFQVGYKGLIDLAYRSGQVVMIDAQVVHENDDFDIERGLEPKLVHKPAKNIRGKSIGYYAIWKGKDGSFGFEYMTKEEIDQHARKFSKSYYDGPWKTNFDEMAKKTVLKKCLKYAPMKAEFSRGVAADGTVKPFDISETADNSDMTLVPCDYVEAEFEEQTDEPAPDDLATRTDPVTGEVADA